MQRTSNFDASVDGQKDVSFFATQIPQQIGNSWPQATLEAPHIMPTPSQTPWKPHEMPWTLNQNDIQGDGVLRFNAQVPRPVNIHQKRKSDLPIPHHLTKQFISEEKITAHFNGLHISSDYIQSSNQSERSNSLLPDSIADDEPSTSGKCFTNLTYEDYQRTAVHLAEKLKNATAITMCDEVRKLQDNQLNAFMLPGALFQNFEKPCTALIPYVPQPAITLLKEVAKKEQKMQGNQKQEENLEDYDDGIDDFFDNNNTCNMDFNRQGADDMDEDI